MLSWPSTPCDFASDLAGRVDEILDALDDPTPERIAVVADYAELEARREPDVLRAAVGRAFAVELRARAGRVRGLAS